MADEIDLEELKTQQVGKIGRNSARQAEKEEVQPATMEDMRRKKAPTRRAQLVMSDEDGNPVERYFVFQTLSPTYYDELLGEDRHRPRKEDKAQGLSYNPDEWSLTLISESMITPKISREFVIEMRDSGQWSRGELGMLFNKALEANHGGLEIPFTKRD